MEQSPEHNQTSGLLGEFFDEAAVERLREYGMTHIDDLIGALEADEASVGTFLGVSREEITQKHQQIFGALSPTMREAVEQLRNSPVQYGALPPECKQTQS